MLPGVEYAPLRPVPLVPAGPVDPERAVEHVAGLLPRLGAEQARALGLTVVAGRGRVDTAREMGLTEPELGRMLATARTALRRSIRPLEGSGWCRRAEALVSSRLDGELDDVGSARLETHLRNCARCVEHERRLVQAQNALVSEFGRAPAAGEPAELTLVEPAASRAPTLRAPAALVGVTVGALLMLAALLVIAAIAFAVVAIVG